MSKNILLGCAAAFVTVGGAHAADLPVKAKPVEYVKICSVYGAGFFYIPGTDTCIKIGGWVRAEYTFQTGTGDQPFHTGTAGRNDRIDSNEYNMRARWVTSIDVRTQTEYGTLRAYTRAGFQTTTGETAQGKIYAERGFIQFAGFTFGRSQSYFDFYANAMYYTGYIGGPSSTGAAGMNVLAYTATFGNGFTATLSLEDGTLRRSAVWDAGTDALAVGATPGPSFQATTGYTGRAAGGNGPAIGDYAAAQVPDIVGSLRVDQAWGSAQIAGALHQVRSGYYGNNNTGNAVVGPGGFTGLAPSDKWGYAIMAGIVINLPWAKGDQFWIEGAYTVGAVSYTGWNQNGQYSNFQRFNGNSVAVAWPLDAVFANAIGPATISTGALGATGLELTTVWTIAAALQHYWTPALRTSVFGAFTATDYNDNATNIFCSSPVGPVRTFLGAAPNFLTGAVLGCNPDFNLWAVGSRTIWNPVPNLDIGVEIVYAKVETKHEAPNAALGRGVLLNFGGSGGRAGGLYAPSSEGVWSGIMRWQRNFWP